MSTPPRHPRRTAFLLSQLGSLTAARFAALLEPLELTPGDAGVLRLLSQSPGISQRTLAARLGAVPSRVVVLMDSLEGRGLVSRTRSASDRRNYALSLTPEGEAMMRSLRGVAATHETTMLHPLSDGERHELHALLLKLAAGHDLDPEVHRGHADGRGYGRG